MLAFFNLGPTEVIVVLLVALLVFGRRLPEVARSLGQGLVEFRKGLRDEPGASASPTDAPVEPKPLPTSVDGSAEDPSDEEGPAEYRPDAPEAEADEVSDAGEDEESRQDDLAG